MKRQARSSLQLDGFNLMVPKMIENIKGVAEEQRVSDTDLLACLWQGLMSSIDFNVNQDQLDSTVLKTIEVGNCSSTLASRRR